MQAVKKLSLALKRVSSPLPQETMHESLKFRVFSRLPIELRRKIWAFAVSDTRVLQVVRRNKSKKSRTKIPSPYTVIPASYGGHHYSALSVNQESRAEALLHLTPLWEAYWNLEKDLPYFECKFKDDDAITQLSEMRKAGKLNHFKHIAIDWMYWDWYDATQSMEFTVTFGNRFHSYEHP
jgi:hypothetical protein